ncbi:MAG: TonB-dependent receptor [Bacteroidaceae bacterium]|nr:TonB-dependent receptor [Bacteroidaceae bacterium]
MRKLTMFLCALLVGVTSAMAQKTITGTVISAEDDMPIIGASVLVKGTTVGAITDVDGNFSIKLPEGSKTLVVSYIGMEKTEAFAREGMVVKLSSATTLDEVIVVGYGVQSREAKTGAVVQVSGDELASIPATSVDKMLQGKMAGVQITSDNGQPGSAASIRVRGTSSLGAGSAPLYVVDGIPVMSGNMSGGATESQNAIALISPSDIASITVLKDAAAASIYGSRAANGVILITTKSGKNSDGKARITARVRGGITTLSNDNNYRAMTGQERVDWYRDAAFNAGYNPDDPGSEYYMPLGNKSLQSYNWMDALTREGTMQEYEVNAQGGNAKTNYYASVAYNKSDGITYGSDYQQFRMRVNVDSELNKWLKFGARVNGAYTKSMGEDTNRSDNKASYTNPFFSGIGMNPFYPIYNEDGSFNFNLPDVYNINPLSYAFDKDSYDISYQLAASMYLQWKPIPQLTFKSNNSVEMWFGFTHVLEPEYMLTTGVNYLGESVNRYTSITTSNTAVYEDTFNDDHTLRVLLGHEYNPTSSTGLMYSVQDVDNLLPFPGTGDPDTREISAGLGGDKLLSFFGNADYNYKQRYYVSASIRTDGSSLFGQNRRWGLFWSVGASWNIEKEAFMQDVNWVNQLKLRYSYGVNGNNNIPAYLAYATYSSGMYNGIYGIYPSSLSNPDLTWETNLAHNVGIDFRFWDRFSGTLEYYHRTTEDMLYATRMPLTTGFSGITDNVGSMLNQGFEAQLNVDIFNRNDFQWTVGFNISMNRSKVLNLGEDPYIGYSNFTRAVVGEQLMQFYLYDYAGVNPNDGSALWYNEDGEITSVFQEARRVYKGSPEPDAIGGLNTSLMWNGLDFSLNLEYRLGSEILAGDQLFFIGDGNDMTTNQLSTALNYWKHIGDTGVMPKPIAGNGSYSATTSTRFLERGDYLRIKDLTLGYTLPTKWTRKAAMSNVRVYVSGYNLFSFHDVNAFDPERGITGDGVMLYPTTKSFIVGLDISF